MIKVIYCMRRKAGLSHGEFLVHWADVHVPVVMANLKVLRLASYVRTLPLEHAYSARVERNGIMLPPFDGIAELSWASEEDMRLAFESDEALVVQRLLARDEAHFVDPAGSCRWVAQQVRHV
ncbi:MAG: EthD domain-containing protein [Stagnimonas sp.]|nr:EthD domain-containing protein [Stagnimonas sp.]